jgi:transcriptional regulator with XRE-family HTH domain
MSIGAGVDLGMLDGDVTAVRVGARVRFIRRRNGWSQLDLSRRVGIAQPVVARIEDGQRLVTIAILYRLAKALEVAPGELLPASDERPKVDVRLPVNDDPEAPMAQVIGGGPGNATQTYLFDLPAGASDGGFGAHPGEELLVVMEGEVVCSFLGRPDVLVRSGQSLVVDTHVAHGMRAGDAAPARFLLVCTDACEG